ncbi:MAG: hypothetical protein QNK04_29340 [Myxococcota bacterium]|nr:hypothetical protein [Myxococcota bacterium]
MKIYALRLATRPLLERAFERLLGSPHVVSCTVEPVLDRVRFVAPPKAGDRIVEAIYQEGGLVWCSRHELVLPDDAWAEGRPSQPGPSLPA